VRRAVYQAIDAGALIAKALGGLGEPAGMMATPGTNGYDPALDRRLPYDPEEARRLLAEAGSRTASRCDSIAIRYAGR
jgi:peptide/nickel transport system substrate-binding protein